MIDNATFVQDCIKQFGTTMCAFVTNSTSRQTVRQDPQALDNLRHLAEVWHVLYPSAGYVQAMRLLVGHDNNDISLLEHIADGHHVTNEARLLADHDA